MDSISSLSLCSSSMGSRPSNTPSDLHSFKMNIMRTLNSQQLLKFNDKLSAEESYSTNKRKSNLIGFYKQRTTRLSSTPCMPVKFNSKNKINDKANLKNRKRHEKRFSLQVILALKFKLLI